MGHWKSFAVPFVSSCLLVANLLSCWPASANATWTVVNLHSRATSSSIAAAVDGVLQGGVSAGSGDSRATVWQSSADSYEWLYPGSASYVRGIYRLDKAGSISGADGSFAVLWSGAANALVNLHPSVAASSAVYAMDATTQVGYALGGSGTPLPSGYHAALWHGAATTFVDLSPPGSVSSFASAVDASGIAGNYKQTDTTGSHAVLWHGTAESVVDLHPVGAYASSAQAISNGRQGGYVQFEWDGPRHAALWSATAESFFDLTPAGGPTIGGAVYGMDGNIQVGGAGFTDGTGGATVWFGTPESAFNLGTLLSSDYTSSIAYAVDIDEFGTIRVVGSAYYNRTLYPHNEAMMWVLVPEPSSLAALVAGLAGLAGVRPRRRR